MKTLFAVLLLSCAALAQNTFCPTNLNCTTTGNNTHSGTETFNGAVTTNSTVTANGATTLAGGVAGTTTVFTGAVTIGTTLGVTGTSTLASVTASSGFTSLLRERDCRIDGTIDTTGAADSSATINTCIANAVTNTQGIMSLPCGTLKINTALNLTNRPGLTLQGCGMAQTQTPSTVANVTYLVCNTAGPCIDTTGSGQTTIRKMTLRLANTSSTPSTIGILEGRDNALGGGTGRFCFAEHNRIEDLTIWTDTNTALNASRGYLGIYNVAAELSVMSNIHILADTPLDLASTNALALSSPYQTLATGCPASLSDTTIISSSFSTVGFAGIEVWGALGVTLVGNNNVLSNGSNTGLTPFLVSSASSDIKFGDLIIESFNAPLAGALAINGNLTNPSGSLIIGGQTGAAAAAILPFAGSLTIANPNLRVYYANGTVNGAISAGAAMAINGGVLDIAGTTSPLSQTNITLTGTKIKAQGFTDANVAFNAASTYEIQTDAGAFEHQPLSVTGQITSTVSTGTPPFVVASTTNIPNLNASSLNGATFANPGTIGTTPAAGTFTTLAATTSITGTETTAPAAAAGKTVCYSDSTSHQLNCSYNNGSFFREAQTIASGTATMPVTAFGAAGCNTAVTVAATGVLTTDTIEWAFTADPGATTGYSTGALHIYPYPTAGNVNFRQCSSAALTPGAATLNWRVVR